MLEIEAQTFVREQIIPRWPRWRRSGVEVSDFVRQLKRLESETALEAIIRTKETSTTYTWPVLSEFRKHIATVIRETKTFENETTEKSDPLDKYISCYALNMGNGKYIEFLSSSGSVDGAKVDFASYLIRHDVVPTDYTLYIGQENFDEFFHTKHDVLCRLDPAIARRVEKLQALSETGTPPWEAYEDDIPF